MPDRLISTDFATGKIIVMRTFTNEDGTTYEKEIELDIPQPPMSEGKIRKVKRDADGKMYEIEETIAFPDFDQVSNKEDKK